MDTKQEYNVLKLVTHGSRCYVSSDCIRGQPLIRRIRSQPTVEKDLFFRWVRELVQNLERFHGCKGNPCYQYMNPYSIVIGEDDRLYLMDLGGDNREEILRVMNRRGIRENFLPADNQYYQKASVGDDLYGLGKTFQYILSVVKIEPKLRWWEEKRMKRVIDLCVGRKKKKRVESAAQILQMLPCAEKNIDGKRKVLRYIPIAATVAGIIFLVIFAGRVFNGLSRNPAKEGSQSSGLEEDETRPGNGTGSGEAADEEQIRSAFEEELRKMQKNWEEEKGEMIENQKKREGELLRELAFLYFLDLGQYDAASDAAQEIPVKNAYDEGFISLCFYMDAANGDVDKKELKKILEKLEKAVPDPGDERYLRCIMTGYDFLEQS